MRPSVYITQKCLATLTVGQTNQFGVQSELNKRLSLNAELKSIGLRRDVHEGRRLKEAKGKD